MKQFDKLNEQLKEELYQLEKEESCIIEQSSRAVELIQKVLSELRKIILKENFKTAAEEITFFKHLKPQIFCLLLYYKRINIIESKRPPFFQIEYLEQELLQLSMILERYSFFYQYYKSNDCHLDHLYFTRGNRLIDPFFDNLFVDWDQVFSTRYDCLVSLFLAIEKMQKYISQEVEKLKRPGSMEVKSRFKWTGSKASLVEVIYALHYSGYINNGTCNVGDLVSVFENIFDINLVYCYNIFSEISLRKKERTPVLDKMKELLIRRMDERY